MTLNDIEKVTYHLHPTFPNNIRDISNKNNNFLFKFKAWGSFQLKAEVYFKGYKKPLILFRYINLHTF
jgi:Transcription initiation factor IIF, auxiliary subunit